MSNKKENEIVDTYQKRVWVQKIEFLKKKLKIYWKRMKFNFSIDIKTYIWLMPW